MRVPAMVMFLLLAGCLGGRPGPAEMAEDDTLPPALCDPCRNRFSTAGGAYEPHALAHPDDPDRITVFVMREGPGPTLYETADGGASWGIATMPTWTAAARLPEASWIDWGDPALAYHDGQLVAAGLGNTVAGAGGTSVLANRDIWVAAIADGPVFGEATVVTTTATPQLFLPASTPFATPDREWIASDGQQAIVTWVRIVSDGIEFRYDVEASRSDDLQQWSAAETVATGQFPRGPRPFYAEGRVHVVFATFGSGGLWAATHGAGWEVEPLGPGVAAPDVHVDGSVYVATTAHVDAALVPVLYVFDGGWKGPVPVGDPVGEAWHVSVTRMGGETWIGWYDDGDASYKVSRVHDDGRRATLVVEDGLVGAPESYGHYAHGLNGHDGGADLVYVAGDEAGRWLHHSRYRV